MSDHPPEAILGVRRNIPEDLRRKVREQQEEIERLRAIVEKPRPTIVCLCGSTRFMEAFFAAGWELTLMGQIVLSVGVCKHADGDNAHGAELAGVAEQLDELHLRKIDLADWVLVLNVEGYYGESTEREIQYATDQGKPVRMLFAPALLPRQGAPPDDHLAQANASACQQSQ